MIKHLFVAVIAVAAFIIPSASASAAPQTTVAARFAPFTGTFRGTVRSDDGSSAPLELEITQQGRNLAGVATLGAGLQVDGGWCGNAAVPAAIQSVTGQTQAGNSRHVSARSQFNVSGAPMTVVLDGDLAPNGKLIKAKATIDIPAFCGRDPVLTGTLYRVK